MSCSKPLPPFTFDLLCYLNRDQLERFSIVCRPMKNFIKRYFNSKPYRIFDRLEIRGGSYALVHKYVQWHPNRDDYSVQQFLAGQYWECSSSYTYYSFAEMRPYLGPTVRIECTKIYVAGKSTYNPEHIAEMESIAHLWRHGRIDVWNDRSDGSQIVAKDLQPILKSKTILKCRLLEMDNAVFSYKDFKILYSVKVFLTGYTNKKIDPDYWPLFLEQPEVKPVVVLYELNQESIDSLLDRLSKAFSSAVLPNAFKIAFMYDGKSLTEFRESNKTSDEILELKKGLPTEYVNAIPKVDEDEWQWYNNKYTLERSSV